MRYFPAILLLLIDYAVQVSDKPKGIAVGAAKDCVHTLSRVFFSFLKKKNALKTSPERRVTMLVEWEHTFKRGAGEKERN